MPHGGRQLYEIIRMDHEPEQVCVFRAGDIDRKRERQADTLVWDRENDPMLYFWPVERQAVIAFFLGAYEEASAARLAKACLRDGARQVTCVRRVDAPKEWQREPWGAPRYGYIPTVYGPAVKA